MKTKLPDCLCEICDVKFKNHPGTHCCTMHAKLDDKSIRIYEDRIRRLEVMILAIRDFVGDEKFEPHEYFESETEGGPPTQFPWIGNMGGSSSVFMMLTNEEAQEHYHLFKAFNEICDDLDQRNPDLVKTVERMCERWSKTPITKSKWPKSNDEDEKKYTLSQLRSAYMAGLLKKEGDK